LTQYYIDTENPHLGGYIPGGDPATYYPRLWSWLVEERGVESVIDVGCGEGLAARYFADHGCDVIGIDGVWQLSQNWHFYMHDYTEGPWPTEVYGSQLEATDLVWSCEFVEHVEEQYVPNFLETFKLGKLVFMTHAAPDQPGHHHVNCQPSNYWQGVMAAVGYSLDWELTQKTRLLAGMDALEINHFRDRGLAFVQS
jgi:SAM-dependent methyltransferase